MGEDDIEDVPNLYIEPDEEFGYSQESTNEDAVHREPNGTVNMIRKMSVKTSDIFTNCKQTDYKNFYKEYNSVRNQDKKNLNFNISSRLKNNLSVKKAPIAGDEAEVEPETSKNIFDQFEEDMANLFSENEGLNVDEQPSVAN
jgi:hypothetical protein